MHARLECCNDRFAANPQYIYISCIRLTYWIERNSFVRSIHFVERKEIQSEINVGQLVKYIDVRRMISDDQILSSFKNIRGTPLYFQNMLLNVLAKIRQFRIYSFFLNCSAVKFYWTEII